MQANGYLIDSARTVYFAGDTAMFPQLSDLRGGVDTALLPVGGWGPTLRSQHLDPRGAAEAAAIVAPRVLLPIHWGTYRPAGVPLGKRFSEPGPRFVEHMSAVAPDIEARLWPIGGPQSVSPALTAEA